jgi:hypothetical protein
MDAKGWAWIGLAGAAALAVLSQTAAAPEGLGTTIFIFASAALAILAGGLFSAHKAAERKAADKPVHSGTPAEGEEAAGDSGEDD